MPDIVPMSAYNVVRETAQLVLLSCSVWFQVASRNWYSIIDVAPLVVYHKPHLYRYLLKSCPVCLIACKPSGKGFLEVVPFKPLHGDSPHPTYRPKDLDVLCLAALRWGLCCGGWRTQTFKRCVVLAFTWCFTGSQRPLDASTLECQRRCVEYFPSVYLGTNFWPRRCGRPLVGDSWPV